MVLVFASGVQTAWQRRAKAMRKYCSTTTLAARFVGDIETCWRYGFFKYSLRKWHLEAQLRAKEKRCEAVITTGLYLLIF